MGIPITMPIAIETLVVNVNQPNHFAHNVPFNKTITYETRPTPETR
jgi:hypothetical protein